MRVCVLLCSLDRFWIEFFWEFLRFVKLSVEEVWKRSMGKREKNLQNRVGADKYHMKSTNRQCAYDILHISIIPT